MTSESFITFPSIYDVYDIVHRECLPRRNDMKKIWFLVIEIETILKAYSIKYMCLLNRTTKCRIFNNLHRCEPSFLCQMLFFVSALCCTFSYCNYDVRLHRINYRGTFCHRKFTRQHFSHSRRYSNFKWFNFDFKNLMRFVYFDTPKIFSCDGNF